MFSADGILTAMASGIGAGFGSYFGTKLAKHTEEAGSKINKLMGKKVEK